MTSKTPGRTFLDINLAGLVLVEDGQRLLEARRVEEELQVLLAAVFQEVDHLFVILYGLADLSSRERAAAVLVD